MTHALNSPRKQGNSSGIQWKLLKQRLLHHEDKAYDVLTVEVTALHDRDWNELKAEWEGPGRHGSPGFDEAAHLQKRAERTVRYVTDYWFEISSFFGRPA